MSHRVSTTRELRTLLVMLASLMATIANAQTSNQPAIDIWKAAAEGNVAAITRHIASGADVNAREPTVGNTPLILASVFGQQDVAKLLIDAGAKLEIKNNERTTALFNAVFFGRPTIVKALVENGADIYATDKTGVSVIDFASAPWSRELEGVYRLVYGLLQMDLDVTETKKFRAATAKYLREQAKKRPPPQGTTDNELFVAALQDDASQITEMVANGANVNGKDENGNTPLHVAAAIGNFKATRALIAAKADLEAKNNEGVTALFNASFFAQPKVVSVLLEEGADATIASRDGATPLEIASSDWNPELEGLYQLVYQLHGQSPEIERIKKQRVEVATLLRERAAKTPLRTWKTADGKKSVQAVFVKANTRLVQLRRTDGRTVTVPIKILSEDDQAYVAKMSKR